MKKNILITGGAGFIGSSLADSLLQSEKYKVVLVDNLLTGETRHLPTHPDCRFVKCDVNDYQEIAPILLSEKFDYVFHYAAVVGVKRTLENPIMVLNDIQGIKNMLNLSKSIGVKRVFFSSSSEVYGEPVELPQHEQTTPLNSRLPYAIVKNVGEAYFRSYKQEHNLDFTIWRFFNTYGEKQSTDFVMSKFLRAALQNQDIPIYGDGSQTRTFCYIQDNVEATINALENDLMINDIANLGNDRITTILELAQLIIKITDSKSKIIHLPPLPDGDMTRRQPDIGKMLFLLKRDLKKLEDGIIQILASKQLKI